MKRILIITPRSPFEGRGADEQDRLSGIEGWIKRGWQVTVITKVFPTDLRGVEEARARYGITIHAVSYKYGKAKTLSTVLKRILMPRYWDGAAFEYFDPEIQEIVRQEVARQPQLVWVDYTYLWPLYSLIIQAGIPLITRSINFEPRHFLDEDGRSLMNYIKAWPKHLSERRAVRESAWLFAITPVEEKIYRTLGSGRVSTLPLRGLPTRLIPREAVFHSGFRIGFTPSTYNVAHNKEALRFLVTEVWPLLSAALRAKTTLHVTGHKFPAEITMPPEVVYEGYVPSSVRFWQEMDIAVAPSLFGAGMQQKIFEPLTLGVPTITSARGLGGYPFVPGEEVICAESAREVAEAIQLLLENPERRASISQAAQKRAFTLFAQARYDGLLEEVIKRYE
jgi:glycosyltransferase involved in cell wall biosynthesis